jgi:hypothetical protein
MTEQTMETITATNTPDWKAIEMKRDVTGTIASGSRWLSDRSRRGKIHASHTLGMDSSS